MVIVFLDNCSETFDGDLFQLFLLTATFVNNSPSLFLLPFLLFLQFLSSLLPEQHTQFALSGWGHEALLLLCLCCLCSISGHTGLDFCLASLGIISVRGFCGFLVSHGDGRGVL